MQDGFLIVSRIWIDQFAQSNALESFAFLGAKQILDPGIVPIPIAVSFRRKAKEVPRGTRVKHHPCHGPAAVALDGTLHEDRVVLERIVGAGVGDELVNENVLHVFVVPQLEVQVLFLDGGLLWHQGGPPFGNIGQGTPERWIIGQQQFAQQCFAVDFEAVDLSHAIPLRGGGKGGLHQGIETIQILVERLGVCQSAVCFLPLVGVLCPEGALGGQFAQTGRKVSVQGGRFVRQLHHPGQHGLNLEKSIVNHMESVGSV